MSPRSARAASASPRSTPPAPSAPTSTSSTPQPRNASFRAASPSASVTTQVGTRRAPATMRAVSGRRSRLSTTIRTGERAARPGSRQSRLGSSTRTVLLPTITASFSARSRWARARAVSPVIQRLSPACVASRPSSVVASFSVTSGRPSRMRRKKPALSAAASSAQTPVSTETPAARSRASPPPETRGSGSSKRHDDAGDARLGEGVGAGRRAPPMAARLEADIGGRAPRGLPGTREGLGLAMRAPARLGPAASHDASVLDDDAADGGVRPDRAEAAPRERQRRPHVTKVGGGCGGIGRRGHGPASALRRRPPASATWACALLTRPPPRSGDGERRARRRARPAPGERGLDLAREPLAHRRHRQAQLRRGQPPRARASA